MTWKIGKSRVCLKAELKDWDGRKGTGRKWINCGEETVRVDKNKTTTSLFSISQPYCIFQPHIYLQRLLQFPICCFHICWEHTMLPVISFKKTAKLFPTNKHVMNGTRPHQSNHSKICQAMFSAVTTSAPTLSWSIRYHVFYFIHQGNSKKSWEWNRQPSCTSMNSHGHMVTDTLVMQEYLFTKHYFHPFVSLEWNSDYL